MDRSSWLGLLVVAACTSTPSQGGPGDASPSNDSPFDAPVDVSDGGADGPPGMVDSGIDATTPADATAGSPDSTDSDASMHPFSAAGNGWSWCVPVPTADTLNSVWSSSATDAWAAGDFGTLLHFDGRAWTAWPSGTKDYLFSLSGVGASDVWAVGDKGTTLHWNGATWLPVPSGTTTPLYGVWGLAANDVWAVGWATAASGLPSSAVLHWNGGAWTSTALPEGPDGASMTAIWASSDTDVYVAGGDSIRGIGVIDHWDGSTWSPVTLPTSQVMAVVGVVPAWSFASIWGADATDIWATGTNAYAFHFKGGAWTYTQGNPDALQGDLNAIVKISGTSASDVFSSNGYHWDGTTWSGVAPAAGASVFARTPSDAWIVGTNGSSSHYDGTTWTNTSPTVPDSGAFNGLSATTPFSGVWASGPDDVYLIGAPFGGTDQHWDGHVWTSFPDPLLPDVDSGSPLTRPTLDGDELIAGSSASDIWIVALMLTPPSATSVVGTHWDGRSWSPPGRVVAAASGVGSLWVTSPTDAWVTTPGFAGYTGTTTHWDGTSWSAVATGVANTGGQVWASAPDDVWVFDALRGGAHWNGTAWSVLPEGGPFVESAWGSGRDDLWAVSGASTGHALALLHWDGVSWAAPTTVDLTAVLPLVDAGVYGGGGVIKGSAPNNVWVMGGGYVARWDGTSWTPSGVSDLGLRYLSVVDGGAGWAAWNSRLLCHPPDAASSDGGGDERVSSD